MNRVGFNITLSNLNHLLYLKPVVKVRTELLVIMDS